MEEKENNLYIPANIKTRMEFFKGFGVRELVITICVMAIFLPIVLILYNFAGTLKAIVCAIVVILGTVIVISKDDNGLCVAKQIVFMCKQLKMQKKFKYKYYDKRREK